MNLSLEAMTSKGVKLIVVGYKYNSSKVLCFVATKNAGPTTPGDPYRVHFLDGHDNLISWPVDHPELISTYFQRSNGIDKHNQARQFELRLEKHWRMHNAWFPLMTTIIGICITDAWEGFRYAFQNQKNDEEITIHEFADRLAYELINKNFECGASDNKLKVLSPLSSPQRRTPRLMRLNKRQIDGTIEGNLVVEISEASVSPLTSTKPSQLLPKNTGRGNMDATVGAAQACAARRHKSNLTALLYLQT
jgi:hypothetical protein